MKSTVDQQWYAALIVTMPRAATPGSPGTEYTVAYSDGTQEQNVDGSRIRHVGSSNLKPGGVVLIDEAYDLDPAQSSEGRAIMAELMAVAENHRDKVIQLFPTHTHTLLF